MKRWTWVVGVVISVTALAAPPTRVGDKAPSFSASDLSGRRVSLADLQGKLIVMHFATSW